MADLTLVADHRGATLRADGRHLELALAAVAGLGDDAHDLGDDVAGLVQHDPVADAHVLAPDLVEVVERGPRDRGAGHQHRREVRHRRERAGATDVGDDVLDHGLHLLGRELVGDGPARCPADHPQPCLQIGAVNLDHDAVGLVGQPVTRLAPALGELDDTVDVETGLVVRLDREAQASSRSRAADCVAVAGPSSSSRM